MLIIINLLGLLYPCWGEVFSLPIYLHWKDEKFGKPWRGLNSKHYDCKRALPTELPAMYVNNGYKCVSNE